MDDAAKVVLKEKVSRAIGKGRRLRVKDLLEGIEVSLVRHGLDPADELIKLITQTVADPETGEPRDLLEQRLGPAEGLLRKIEILKYLNEFIRPKKRSVESSVTTDHNFTIVIKQYQVSLESNAHGDRTPIQVESTVVPTARVDVLPERSAGS